MPLSTPNGAVLFRVVYTIDSIAPVPGAILSMFTHRLAQNVGGAGTCARHCVVWVRLNGYAPCVSDAGRGVVKATYQVCVWDRDSVTMATCADRV